MLTHMQLCARSHAARIELPIMVAMPRGTLVQFRGQTVKEPREKKYSSMAIKP